MASIYADQVVPAIISRMDLARQRPGYIAALAVQPTVTHDFAAGDGEEVQVYRDRFIGNVGLSKTARTVLSSQPIGRPSSTPFNKSTVRLRLAEYMGPVDGDNLAAPLIIDRKTMLFGRRKLWEGNLPAFSQSIGGVTLADDYQRWYDFAMITSELQRTTSVRNPGGVADGSTSTSSKWSVADHSRVMNTLAINNTPRFQDGYYHSFCNDLFLRHLREDNDFKADQRAAITGQFFEGSQQASITYTGTQPAINTPSGMPMFIPPSPVVYDGTLFYPTNNLPNKTVNSISTNLGYYFGPGSVLLGTGGAQGQVEVRVHEDTDYQRLFAYIWAVYGASINPITPAGDPQEGVVVEARSMAA
jgi:hypothetical protein